MQERLKLYQNGGMRNTRWRRIRKLLFGDSLRVSSNGNGVWRLPLRWGRDHFDNQHEAINAGVRYARAMGLGRIIVEREDGSVQEEIYFW